MRQRLTMWLGSVGVSLIASGCIVSAAPEPTPIVTPNYGYAPAGDGEMVGEPSPYEVSSMPPEPLYEQMSASPGYGYVWIDGYWHWNGYEWVWVSGRWEREQDGYAYVQPYYAYNDGAYIYTPGYWRNQRDLPRGWVVGSRGDGRPPTVRPPTGYRPPVNGRGLQPASIGNNRPPPSVGLQPNRPIPNQGEYGGHGPVIEPGPYRGGPGPIANDPQRGPVIEKQPYPEREPESRFPPQAPHPDPEPYVPAHPESPPVVERGGGGVERGPGVVQQGPAERPSAPPPSYQQPHPPAPSQGAAQHPAAPAAHHPTK